MKSGVALQEVKIVRVEGPFSKILFHGAEVSVGFIASLRKERHLDCESGRGFLTYVLPDGKKLKHTCPCAEKNARRKLAEIGRDQFQALGAAWQKEEMERRKTEMDKQEASP